MTDQLHDPAWQQQEPDDVWYDEGEGYPVQCDGCGAWCVIGMPPGDEWYCPPCQEEEA